VTVPARVLVIDDEAVMHRLMTRALRGYEVVALDDARQALALLAAGEQFQVIICDLNMPGMSGVAFHKALSAIPPRAADEMLFFTGGAVSDEAALFLQKVRGRVLQKPVEVSRLRAAVEEILGKAPK
jgi:CheY-like chemotaxis protein